MAMRRAVAIIGLLLSSAAHAQKALYVSTNGAHQAPYTNWTMAATNIHSALNSSVAGDTIMLSNGVHYLPEQARLGYTGGMTTNANKNIRFTSLNGAEFTSIQLIPTNQNFFPIAANAAATGGRYMFDNLTFGPTALAGDNLVVIQPCGGFTTISNCVFDRITNSGKPSAIGFRWNYLGFHATVQVVNCVFDRVGNVPIGDIGYSGVPNAHSFVSNCVFRACYSGVYGGSVRYMNVFNSEFITCSNSGGWGAATTQSSNIANCIAYYCKGSSVFYLLNTASNCVTIGGSGGQAAFYGGQTPKAYNCISVGWHTPGFSGFNVDARNCLNLFGNIYGFYGNGINSAFAYCAADVPSWERVKQTNLFRGTFATVTNSPRLVDSDYYDANWHPGLTGTNFVLGPRGLRGLMPRADSPLRNMGLTDFAPFGNALALDAVDGNPGLPRINEDAVDIGPFEFYPAQKRARAHMASGRR